jgi:hypothetical protein
MGSKFLKRHMNLGFRKKKDDHMRRKIKSKRFKNTRGTEERDAFGGTVAEPEPLAELEDAMDPQKL